MGVPAVLSRGPVQIAYGVDDVDTAAHAWAAAGVGPFFVRDHIPLTNVVIDGTPAVLDHSSAFGWWGEIMVELICIHSPAHLSQTGVHHLAWFVDSFAESTAALADAGMAPRIRASAGSTNFAMHGGGELFGHLVEIYEPNDSLVGFYDMVRNTAATWDGHDPIRTLSSRPTRSTSTRSTSTRSTSTRSTSTTRD